MAEDDPNMVYCIECGEELSADAEFCPDCGSSQFPQTSSGAPTTDSGDHSGFTSWAIGFQPGKTGRNILVGLAYLIGYPVGIPLLVYGYLREYPKNGKYFAWAGGALLILMSVSFIAEGTTRGIVGGIAVLGLGLFFLPIVREKVGIGNLPGIDEHHSARRNVLTGVAYGLGSLVVIGAAAPNTDDGGTPGSDSGSAEADSSSSSNEGDESHSDAWYYDESSGIALYDVNGSSDDYATRITGEAVNHSDDAYEYVQISFALYDDSDAKVGDAYANTGGLESGQRWKFEAIGSSSGNVSSFALDEITAY